MRGLLLLALVGICACSIRPGENRAARDLTVGLGSTSDTRVEVEDGLAAVRALEPGRLELWAQAPSLAISLDASEAPARSWELRIRNILPDAALVVRDSEGRSLPVLAGARPLPTVGVWTLEVPAGARLSLELASADALTAGAFEFGVMADVQTALPTVGDIFARMADDPALRFVVASGDLTASGAEEELIEFQEKLEALPVPFYATLGNHELFVDEGQWTRLFGRANVNFLFRGVHFTLVDSGEGTLDPSVNEWLQKKLEAGREAVHVFATHIPLFDPVGTRDGGFASKLEAAALLESLRRSEVDVTFYGHVHSYYAYSNAGIPAYITGGGGALPERMDGIGRHYLRALADEQGLRTVALVRVD